MLQFEEKIKEWSGECVKFKGTKYYYHMPILGENRYLHRIYNPLKEDRLDQNIQNYLSDAHPDLVNLWKFCNGINLFMGYIYIFGFQQENFNDDGPKNIVYCTNNNLIKMYNENIDVLNIQFCGGYASGNALIYLRDKRDKFYLISMKDYKPLQVFDTLEEFIDYYIEIEQGYRDENGLRKKNVGYDAVLRPKDIEFQKQFPSIEALIG